ncbi:universal stress protein [Bizionia saleffrena]|uniref:Universal stress protein n=1 Tax=Bizionia saleffrena TaxID=291189 RepID=A0A8H2LDS0_9FLAO|nr:universal stress protein [Bizionia saleffrena]TYB72551.1 universal stress protein [Bizionia saleffrena]
MRHKILLATDFSKNSVKAIHYARELYKNDFCDFYLLNAFSTTRPILKSLLQANPEGEWYQTAKLDSENGLAKVFDIIALNDNFNSKHSFKVISTYNTVVDAIKIIVDEKDIEMVVVGTKGETDALTTSFGSVAVNVMEKIRNCPVIVVPNKAQLALPRDIVFPTSYKTHYKRRELNYLTNIAKSCNATIVVLHILEQDELDKRQLENKKLLQEILKGTDYKFHNVSSDSVLSAVNICVESRSSGMVAFINRKHVFFESILTNPMVKEISFQLNVPILALHDLRN